MAKRKDLTNIRYGRLIAIKDIGAITNGYSKIRLWECICDCGKLVTKRSSQLLQGNCSSCGCLRSEVCRAKVLLPSGISGFNSLIGVYQASAKRKNFEFTLTNEQFREITSSNCYYCGIEPKQISKITKGITSYIYNGIDRMNNNKGYTIENSVACCKECNFLKSSRNMKEFCDLVNKISNNLRLK